MKTPEGILPWHQEYWKLFLSYIRQQRVPQALLIYGNIGLGKVQLALQMAQALLCETPLDSGIYCGQCHSCTFFEAGTHPDFMLLEPETETKIITVSQVRNLISKLQLKSQFHSYRVIIVKPADLLNPSAANSFLKNLEEPAEKTVILLITDRLTALPATIVSRCQKMYISRPEKEIALNWLQERIGDGNEAVLLNAAYGAPLLAVSYAQEQFLALRQDCFNHWLQIANHQADPVRIADEWQKHSEEILLNWLITWTMDLIKYRYSLSQDKYYPLDLQQPLQVLAQKLNLKGLFEYYNHLLQARNNLGGHLNTLLSLEETLIIWSQLNT